MVNFFGKCISNCVFYTFEINVINMTQLTIEVAVNTFGRTRLHCFVAVCSIKSGMKLSHLRSAGVSKFQLFLIPLRENLPSHNQLT